MRRSGFLPRTSHSQTSLRAPEPPQRKIFNCIVDDTALIAGVKKSTRDGIRKWNSQGAVRLFVPLHTLNQLLRLKHGTERINADAREAVKWLDEATSVSDPNTAASVQLQGVDETYPTWAEVEKHLLPETLLSMEDSASDEDDYHEDLESSFNALDVSDQTSVSSSHSYEDVPKTPEMPICALRKDSMAPKSVIEDAKLATLTIESPDRTARNSIEVARSEKSPNSAVPVHFQPLFNHIMWLVNKESNPDAALESYILLTNDPAKQAIAQKFGIRAKRLEQLRDAVAREDREYKNHLTMHKIEAEGTTTKEKAPLGISKVNERPKSSPADCKPHDHSDDEDVVLFQRAPRGPAAITKNQRVFDPNDFGRTNQIHAPRGGRGGHAAPRGRGNAAFRGRGNFTPRGAYVAPGSAARAPAPAPVHDPTQPLDPESFARPMPKGGPIRGGARRKLWEPN